MESLKLIDEWKKALNKLYFHEMSLLMKILIL
jgi:hypothetical protein